jgi:GDP/UDP-N,N'-diacetylbacillosamine 2-epimerase (hydrolysing)
MLNNIPIAHIGGGAVTAGAIDDSMRHCLSKMSQIHFTGAETERNRVLQLGESPEMVFNFGELTVDIIKETPLMSRKELEKSLNIKFKRRNILITFHPETLSPDDSPEHFRILLNELDKTRDTLLIFTAPNNDPGGDVIMAEIKKYNRMNPLKTAFFESLGKVRYLSALKIVDAVVGNSSSGLAEAPSFKTPAINVGNRQDGRLKASSVIDCEPDPARLSEALRKLYSAEFRKTLPFTVNPYGEGGASAKIKKVLKNICLDNIIMKKFNDIPCPQGFQ